MLKPISSVRWFFDRMKNRQRCLWLKSFQIGKYRNFLSTDFGEEDVLPSKLYYCILVDSQPQCHSHFFHFAFDFESNIKYEIDSLVCMENQMFQCELHAFDVLRDESSLAHQASTTTQPSHLSKLLSSIRKCNFLLVGYNPNEDDDLR